MNSSVIQEIEDDGPIEEDFTQSIIILVAPFFICPVTIILYRVVMFTYRIFQASLLGKGLNAIEFS